MRANGWVEGAKSGCGVLLAAALALLGGCTTTGVLLSAAGVATDTSVTWEIVKHVHAKLTEGDPVPCVRLDSVEKALNTRCGAFVPGSLLAKDVGSTKLQGCLLAVAVRDPRLWPVVPELVEKGAGPETCAQSPLVALAQAPGCPDFSVGSPEVRAAFKSLAEGDPRAVNHDVMRMLSCPSAVAVGLDGVLAYWLARGDLDAGTVAFGPLEAIHPAYLASPFAETLASRGHTAREGMGGYDGVQPRSFELALRTCEWEAIDWWLQRMPELANRVPPAQGNQLAWAPLARVVTPKFLAFADSQGDMVKFLMARGADPWRKLPYDAGTSIVEYARRLNSPLVSLLNPETAPAQAAVVATTAAVAPGQ